MLLRKLNKLEMAGLEALQRSVDMAQQALHEAQMELGLDSTHNYIVDPDGTIREGAAPVELVPKEAEVN